METLQGEASSRTKTGGFDALLFFHHFGIHFFFSINADLQGTSTRLSAKWLTSNEKYDIVNSPTNKYFNHTVAPLVSRVLNKEIFFCAVLTYNHG
jgi:hypothetical protein